MGRTGQSSRRSLLTLVSIFLISLPKISFGCCGVKFHLKNKSDLFIQIKYIYTDKILIIKLIYTDKITFIRINFKFNIIYTDKITFIRINFKFNLIYTDKITFMQIN